MTTKNDPEMVLVPRAPTKEMLEAAWGAALAEDAEGVWKSMIEAWMVASNPAVVLTDKDGNPLSISDIGINDRNF